MYILYMHVLRTIIIIIITLSLQTYVCNNAVHKSSLSSHLPNILPPYIVFPPSLTKTLHISSDLQLPEQRYMLTSKHKKNGPIQTKIHPYHRQQARIKRRLNQLPHADAVSRSTSSVLSKCVEVLQRRSPCTPSMHCVHIRSFPAAVYRSIPDRIPDQSGQETCPTHKYSQLPDTQR